MKIYKHVIGVNDRPVKIQTLGGAVVVHAGMDPATGLPAIWAAGDESKQAEKHDVMAVGTGHDLTFDPHRHIGTAICGGFVWHLFSETLRRAS